LAGLAMEDAGIFFEHLVYFTSNWYILWLFGIFIPRFSMLYQEKSGNPAYGGVAGWPVWASLGYFLKFCAFKKIAYRIGYLLINVLISAFILLLCNDSVAGHKPGQSSKEIIQTSTGKRW
jgi:hypothetical protein